MKFNVGDKVVTTAALGDPDSMDYVPSNTSGTVRDTRPVSEFDEWPNLVDFDGDYVSWYVTDAEIRKV